MKRRRAAGEQRTKALRRKAAAKVRPARRSAAKPGPAAAADRKAQLQDSRRERDEARAQLAATADVLRVISSSPGDLQPVFQTIVKNAVRVCGAKFGGVFRWDGDSMRLVAMHNIPRAYAEARSFAPFRPSPEHALGRVIATGKAVQIADAAKDPGYIARRGNMVAAVELGGVRTFLCVPILKENKLVGACFLARQEVRPFTAEQIALVTSFAGQAAIAIENTRLVGELRESLAQQTATADVLKVISRSTFDLQKVLDTLSESAARLCAADMAVVTRRDGDVYRAMANYGFSPEVAHYVREHSVPGNRGSVVGRAALEGRPVHVADVLADPEYRAGEQRAIGRWRTALGVPLLRDGKTIGVFGLLRREVNPFTEKQIELVTTFADQAAIAIENTRLFEAEQQRTRELAESLAQQTAMSEVLRVISSSPGDLNPVFAVMLENAVRICDATFGNIYRWDGELLHILAAHNTPPALAAARRQSAIRPASIVARMVETKTASHVADLAAHEAYLEERDAGAVSAVELGGVRTFLIVPMLKENELIGAFSLYRGEVRPFTDKQVALVTSFAAQAVIAIENTRLLSELRESLEQQTATAKVLEVISRSAFDLQAVFETVVESSARLCGAGQANLFRFDGELLRLAATVNVPQEAVEWMRQHPIRPGRHSGAARTALERRTVHIPDILADPDYSYGAKDVQPYRTILGVPILKGEELLGVLLIYLLEVRPFTAKQIALVETFADQAAIAIENTRLFEAEQQRTRELAESLEHQTASSEVLQVINASPGDLAPVFDAIVDKAMHLCGAGFGGLWIVDGDLARAAATRNLPKPYVEFLTRGPLPPAHAFGRSLEDRPVLHIADLAATESYRQRVPVTVASVELGGIRTYLAVPLREGGTLAGVLSLYRKEVRPFNDRQIALVQGFAAQAEIAMKNARLLNETRESLEQQTATAEVLRVISSSPGDLDPVFQAMLTNAARICDAKIGGVYRGNGDTVQLVATTPDLPPAYAAAARHSSFRPAPDSLLGRLMASRAAIQIADFAADEQYVERRDPFAVAAVELGGLRTGLIVPMLKENEPIGFFTLARQEVRPFTAKQIELVRSFASQAVIAIENTRLLTELRQRTTDLTESLEQQTATSEVLQVISSSPGDLKPVFQTMLENAVRICDATFGNVYRWDGETLHIAASHNTPPGYIERRRRSPFRAGDGTSVSRMILTRAVVHLADLQAEPEYLERSATDPSAAAGFVRTFLAVPIVKENELIGAFLLSRHEVRPFTDKQIALVTSFAAQAVIAIENTRLLTELRESLAQQTATSEVLRVISKSPGDLEPVFASMLENAVRICGAKFGGIYRIEGDSIRLVSLHKDVPAAYAGARRFAPFRPSPKHYFGRMMAAKEVLHVIDTAADAGYAERRPEFVAAVELGGVRTFMAVPMLKDNELIGAFLLARQEVRPFTDKQINLVKNFAAQAVIAIENTRLLTDLRESLEQQTATTHVLEVISRSPGDLLPVFATMLENAARICDASFGNIYRWDGEALHLSATHNTSPAFAESRQRAPVRPQATTALGRVVATKTVVHVHDATAEKAYAERDPTLVTAVELGGVRTVLFVPMLKENELVGVFSLCRSEVRPFTDKQIALVTNFAAQAVIAIENTRLLSELRQRTDELGRSVGELRALGEVSQAVNSTLDLETVLSTIVAKAVQLTNTDAGAIYVFDEAQREFHLRATYGMSQELIALLTNRHIGLDETVVTGVLAQREPTQIADLREGTPNEINEITLRAGYRARMTAPLFRGDEIVGLLVVRRCTPGAFPQNTVDLIKTFAAQSVLAIQNARMFHEIEDKSRELEIAGRHKSQFLANMSHELRTPLNAIIGYSEILQEDVADLGQDNLIADLKKVEGAGRHLLGLINDILDLSKVEAGKMDVFLEDVEVVPLLEEVRSLIVPLAEKNNNTLELRLAADLGRMRTDRTKLKQSLLNVLSNGSKFTENGRLTLAAERVAEPGGREMLRFAVSDTGIGMNEEQLGRLFQAFTQADTSTTKKYGGTGLGLAISRRFCQLLGGDITVTSAPGQGSTFTIIVPAKSGAAAPAQIKPADAPHLAADVNNGPTVLIVDDDPAARELLAASLKGAGYRLVHAAGGAQALDLARRLRPDVITLDVIMPKPDGWEVLSALKADADLCDIPVIMITVAPERGIGLSLGAVEVLTKPVDRARLAALVHRVARREGPVLIVEDDPDTRDMMRHTIEKMSLPVAEAGNGRLALAWLDGHAAPAVILLDLMMPEMDGFEFLDALARRAEWREIPVIVITAKQLTAAERERLSRQARKVMEKGTASQVDVAVAVGEAVRRRSARRAAANASEKLGQE